MPRNGLALRYVCNVAASLRSKKLDSIRESKERATARCALRQAVPSLPRACSPQLLGLSAPSGSISCQSLPPHPRIARSIAPHSSPHSPQPPRDATGASLFVPDSSRANYRSSSDYARRGKDGTALWRCGMQSRRLREAHIKTHPVFPKSRGSPPAGYLQAADPVAGNVFCIRFFLLLKGRLRRLCRWKGRRSPNNCCRNWRLLVQFRRRMDGPHGGIVRPRAKRG